MDIPTGKVLQKFIANALEENQARAFSRKLVGQHQKKTIDKRVSGGMLLNMLQKRAQT